MVAFTNLNPGLRPCQRIAPVQLPEGYDVSAFAALFAPRQSLAPQHPVDVCALSFRQVPSASNGDTELPAFKDTFTVAGLPPVDMDSVLVSRAGQTSQAEAVDQLVE